MWHRIGLTLRLPWLVMACLLALLPAREALAGPQVIKEAPTFSITHVRLPGRTYRP